MKELDTTLPIKTATRVINEVIIPKLLENTNNIKATNDNIQSLTTRVDDLQSEIDSIDEILGENKGEAQEYTDKSVEVYKNLVDGIKENILSLEDDLKTDKKDIVTINNRISALNDDIKILQSVEYTEYNDMWIKDMCNNMAIQVQSIHDELKSEVEKVANTIPKENTLTSVEVVEYINNNIGIIEASSVRGLIEEITSISNRQSTVKVSGSILEIVSNGRSIMQGATRLNFTGGSPTITGGTVNIPLDSGGGQLVKLSKVLTYNTDGTLATMSDSAGVKTFFYTSGFLASLVGLGVYRSETFTYNSLNQLTDTTVI